MFNNFGINISNLFKVAEKERYELKHPYVGTEHLLLAILKCDEELKSFLSKYNLTYDNFKKELILVVGTSSKSTTINLYTPMLKRVINTAISNSKEKCNGVVSSKELLLAIIEEGEGIAIRLLLGMGIDTDIIYSKLNDNIKSNKKLEIFEVGVLLNSNINMNEQVIGRDKEIDSIIETLLRKKKNNPLLIGDAGVGKTAIVEEFVRRIEKKEVPEDLFDKKVVSLEMGALVSGTKYRGEFEEKLTKIIKELENNPDIILFIDEIHSMVNAGGAEGAINASDIFKPALARGDVKCIGATTTEEYQRYFQKDKALMRRFEVINICEPNNEETKDILYKIKNEYETHHNVNITDDNINLIVSLTDKFIKNKKNPDKSIDFLDSVCSRVKSLNNYNVMKKDFYNKLSKLREEKEKAVSSNDYDKAVLIYSEEVNINNKLNSNLSKLKYNISEKDIIEVLENKTNMVFTLDKMKFLDNIKVNVNSKLFNLENETNMICELIKNNLINKMGCLKVYLEGGKYLGKSSLVKIIGESFPKANYIRIDLSEFRSSTDINKLIGTTQGYIGYGDEHLLSRVKNNNFNIIHFDNYSLCHDNVKELIKEILKEKCIRDNLGEKIYFDNSFIFITDDIIKKSSVGFSNEQGENVESELYGLVDKVIKFKSLDKKTVLNYLDKYEIEDKDEILNKCNYEIYNYKKLCKMVTDKLLVR